MSPFSVYLSVFATLDLHTPSHIDAKATARHDHASKNSLKKYSFSELAANMATSP